NPGNELEVIDYVNTALKTQAHRIFGEHDCIISFIGQPLGLILRNVLKLREALKEKITSTSTIITGKFTGVTKTPNEWHFELPTQYVQWIQEVTIINNRSEEYISYIASETLHALRLYEKMKKDRLSSLVFRRIEPLLDVFITELKNSIENKSFDQ